MKYFVTSIVLICIWGSATTANARDCFKNPQNRVPIKVVGDRKAQLDAVQFPSIEFHEVSAIDASREILRKINANLNESDFPFELSFSLATFDALPKPITLTLKDVNGTLALQYLTALISSHFFIYNNFIVIFPESEATFRKAEQGAAAKP